MITKDIPEKQKKFLWIIVYNCYFERSKKKRKSDLCDIMKQKL